MERMTRLAKDYTKWVDEEMTKTPEEMKLSNVGKINPKNHLK